MFNRSYNHKDVLTRASMTIQLIDDIVLYKAQLFSTNGNILSSSEQDTTVSVVVFKGTENITQRFTDIVWSRFSADNGLYQEDLKWGEQHKGKTTINVTRNDINEKANIQVAVYDQINGERKLVASDFISFVDVNDIKGSNTPPANPKDGDLWLNTNSFPPKLMVWNAQRGEWVEMIVAGEERRNLLRNSNFYGSNFKHWTKVGSPTTSIEKMNEKKWARIRSNTAVNSYCGISQIIEAKSSTKYAFQMLSKIYAHSANPNCKAVVAFYSINSNDKKTLIQEKSIDITLNAATHTTTFTSLVNTKKIEVVVSGQKQAVFDFVTTNLKLEANSIPTAWEIAIEDMEDALNEKVNNSPEEVFNSLTNGGNMQGIYVDVDENGKKHYYFNASYIKSGHISGQFINAKNLTVRDKNNDLTLGIDDNGNVTIKAASLSIGTKSVASKDDVNTSINNMHIGGRNIIKDSGTPKSIVGTGTTNKTGCHYQFIVPYLTDIKGKELIVAFDWKYEGKNPSGTFIMQTGEPQYATVVGTQTISATNTSGTLTKIWKPTGAKDTKNVYIRTDNMTGTFTISNLRIYFGTKDIGWTPAPEDVKSQIDANKTEISSTQTKVASIETNLTGITQRVSKTEQIASSSLQGKMLYTDSTFKNGMNSINPYNNAGNGNVTVSRVAKSSDCPTTSGYMLEIKTTGAATPGHGGFYFANGTRANAIFITKIIAKIPTGRTLAWASNSYGDGGKQEWLTSTDGTGNWQEYICKVSCGGSGTFSSTNFFYLSGGSAPVTWYVAMATVFDTTDTSNIEIRLSSAEQKITDEAITEVVKKSVYTKSETDDQITSKGYQTATEVKKAVEGLEVKVSESGGYNLLRNSIFKNNEIEEWWYWDNAHTYGNKDYFKDTGDMWFGVSEDNAGGLWQSHHELEPNTEYTLSLKIGWEYNVKEAKFVIEYTPDYENNGAQIDSQHFGFQNDGSIRQSVTFTTPANIRYAKMGVWHGGSKGGANGYLIYINKPCLTKGIGKAWTPNPIEALDKATSAKQTAEGFNASITKKLQDDYYKKTDIDATVNGLQVKMQENGGYNLLVNGRPSMKGTGGWSIREYQLNGPDLYRTFRIKNDEWTGYEPAFELRINNMYSGEYRMSQDVETTPGQTYILTGYIAGHRCNKSVYIRSQAANEWDITRAEHYGDDIYGAGSADDYSRWVKISIPFVAQRSSTCIEIMITNTAGSMDGCLFVKKLMLTAGSTVKPWTPNPNELYEGVVDIGRDGVVVTHSNGSYTQMSHNGLEHWENGMARPYHYMFDTVVFDAHGKCNGTPFRVQLPEKFRGKRFTLTWQMGNLNVPYDKVSAGHQVSVTNVDYNNATCDVTVKVFTKSKVSGGASADAEAYGWAKIFIVY